jgi:uncharacterized protein (TIGR02246 family)
MNRDIRRRLTSNFLVALTVALTTAALAAETTDATAIRLLLDKQVADWNRGDIEAFASGYKDSPDILFIGTTINHGYDQMLANYKARYPTTARMGKLSFSNLEVQPLDTHFATATGNFHLERSAADGANADGHYLLVLEKTAKGWKIVRDDTTLESNVNKK